MERPEAYPITYGMLGLLAFWGPMSGYDIKHVFDTTLAPMWGAAHSQIYKELRRMQELGWVDMEREEQEARPDRKVYSITEKGNEALREWQAQPVDVFQLRDELLLKVLFGTFAAPEHLEKNVQEAIIEHERRLSSYRQASYFIPARGEFRHGDKRYNPYTAESEEDPYFRLIAHFAIEFEKMYLRWLQETVDFIQKRQTTETNESQESPM